MVANGTEKNENATAASTVYMDMTVLRLREDETALEISPKAAISFI